MGGIILLLIFILLIVIGVVTSVRLYSHGVIGTGRFRNIRRTRTIKETPGGKIIEETIEETTDEEEPVAETEAERESLQ